MSPIADLLHRPPALVIAVHRSPRLAWDGDRPALSDSDAPSEDPDPSTSSTPSGGACLSECWGPRRASPWVSLPRGAPPAADVPCLWTASIASDCTPRNCPVASAAWTKDAVTTEDEAEEEGDGRRGPADDRLGAGTRAAGAAGGRREDASAGAEGHDGAAAEWAVAVKVAVGGASENRNRGNGVVDAVAGDGGDAGRVGSRPGRDSGAVAPSAGPFAATARFNSSSLADSRASSC